MLTPIRKARNFCYKINSAFQVLKYVKLEYELHNHEYTLYT